MKNLVLIFSCLMAMCVMSCGEDATVNPPGDGSIPGTISGRVLLFDEYGDSLSNHSGVAVKLVNENKTYTATTDASGNYKLEKVIAGIYKMTFSKETFKDSVYDEVQFVGNGTLKRDGGIYPIKRKSKAVGMIDVADQYGEMLDRSGVTVSIEGTNLTAITLPDGLWYMKGLADGKHTVNLSKPGFEVVPGFDPLIDFKNDSVEGKNQYFFGSGGARLLQNSTIGVNLELLKTTVPDTGKIDSAHGYYGEGGHDLIEIFGTLTSVAPNKQLEMMVFYGDQNVSVDNYQASAKITTNSSMKRVLFSGKFFNDGHTQNVPSELKQKFSKGSQVFVKAYTVNRMGGIFTDPKTGGKRAVGFGPSSNVISFTMP